MKNNIFPFHVRLANLIMDIVDFLFKAFGWMFVMMVVMSLVGMYIMMWCISLGFTNSSEIWPNVSDLRWWFVAGNCVLHFMIILGWAEHYSIRIGK